MRAGVSGAELVSVHCPLSTLDQHATTIHEDVMMIQFLSIPEKYLTIGKIPETESAI